MIDYPSFPSYVDVLCFDRYSEHEWKLKFSTCYNDLYWCINCGAYKSITDYGQYKEIKFYQNPALEPR